MNLYQLTDNYQELLDLLQSVDTTQTEYKEVLKDTLDSIKDAYEVKIDGYAMVMNQLKADIKMVKDEINRLNDKKKAYENNLERMKDVLEQSLMAIGKNNFKTNKFSIWIQNNPPSVDIKDEKLIPKEFWIPQPDKLDKQNLLKALKIQDIPGAEIKQTRGVRFK